MQADVTYMIFLPRELLYSSEVKMHFANFFVKPSKQQHASTVRVEDQTSKKRYVNVTVIIS